MAILFVVGNANAIVGNIAPSLSFVPELPSLLATLTSQNVQSVCDYFAQAPPPITNLEELMMQNIKMRECGQVLADWRISRFIDDPSPCESTRISSRVVYRLTGSATGEEAIALLKVNKDEKATTVTNDAATVAVVAKKDDVFLMKAQDIS
jgi:hypothetical protein